MRNTHTTTVRTSAGRTTILRTTALRGTALRTRALHDVVLLTVLATMAASTVRARVAADRERGAHTVEYAVIGGVVVAIAVALGIKLTSAYNKHSANIK